MQLTHTLIPISPVLACTLRPPTPTPSHHHSQYTLILLGPREATSFLINVTCCYIGIDTVRKRLIRRLPPLVRVMSCGWPASSEPCGGNMPCSSHTQSLVTDAVHVPNSCHRPPTHPDTHRLRCGSGRHVAEDQRHGVSSRLQERAAC